jgi:hypothetical protein
MNNHLNQHVLIDRLAAGELDEADRGQLFSWLDGEPTHWRRCALALLEARELEQAFGAWRTEAPANHTMTRAPATPRRQHGAIFALAASIVIAFTLGLFARGFWIASEPLIAKSRPTANTSSPVKPTQEAHAREIAEPSDGESERNVTAVAKASPSAPPSDTFPSYLRSQLERRGYQITSRQARLPVVLPDGRRMMLPVDQLQLNYVGQRTY